VVVHPVAQVPDLRRLQAVIEAQGPAATAATEARVPKAALAVEATAEKAAVRTSEAEAADDPSMAPSISNWKN
jgi:hypothetical protein